MEIYIFNFIFNMLVGILLGVGNSDVGNKRKIKYLVFTCIQFGLLCGFRGLSVGYDTVAYSTIFSRTADNWNNLFVNEQYIESGFAILCSIVKICGGTYQLLLVISALFTTASWCVFVYRHSENVLFSTFLIIAFPYYYHSFDLIRYFIAMSFILLGYKYIEQEKLVKYIAFVICGSLFHRLVLVFVLLYFVPKIKWNKITISLTLAVTLICMQYLDKLAVILANLIGKNVDYDWVGQYAGGVKIMLMYAVLFCIAALAYRYCVVNKTLQTRTALSHVFMVFLCSLIFIQAAMAVRLLLMFLPLMAIAFTKLLSCKNNEANLKNGRILRICIVSIGMAYQIFMLLNNYQNIVPYIPFWKSM